MSRVRRTSVLIFAVTGLAAIAPAAASSHSVSCDARRGTTKFVDEQIRVYWTLKGRVNNQAVRIYECRRRGGSSKLLLKGFSSENSDLIVLHGAKHSGNYFVTETEFIGGDSEDTILAVYTLAGRVVARRSLQAFAGDYWLTQGGGLVTVDGDTPDADKRLTGFDAGGRHLLATGVKDPAVAGNTVYWTDVSDPPGTHAVTLQGHAIGTG